MLHIPSQPLILRQETKTRRRSFAKRLKPMSVSRAAFRNVLVRNRSQLPNRPGTRAQLATATLAACHLCLRVGTNRNRLMAMTAIVTRIGGPPEKLRFELAPW